MYYGLTGALTYTESPTGHNGYNYDYHGYLWCFGAILVSIVAWDNTRAAAYQCCQKVQRISPYPPLMSIAHTTVQLCITSVSQNKTHEPTEYKDSQTYTESYLIALCQIGGYGLLCLSCECDSVSRGTAEALRVIPYGMVWYRSRTIVRCTTLLVH